MHIKCITKMTTQGISGKAPVTDLLKRCQIVLDGLEHVRKQLRRNIDGEDIQTESTKRTMAVLPKGEYAGKMKLCMQYFGSSRTLRIVMLTASDVKLEIGQPFVRLSLRCCNYKKTAHKLYPSKVILSGRVVFNKDVYFEKIGEADIKECILTVRLYNKEGFLKSRKLLGEMVVPLFKYDLTMDTNVTGNLRKLPPNEQVHSQFDAKTHADGDIEVTTADRSIQASVAAKVKSNRMKTSSGYRCRNYVSSQSTQDTDYSGAREERADRLKPDNMGIKSICSE